MFLFYSFRPNKKLKLDESDNNIDISNHEIVADSYNDSMIGDDEY